MKEEKQRARTAIRAIALERFGVTLTDKELAKRWSNASNAIKKKTKPQTGNEELRLSPADEIVLELIGVSNPTLRLIPGQMTTLTNASAPNLPPAPALGETEEEAGQEETPSSSAPASISGSCRPTIANGRIVIQPLTRDARRSILPPPPKKAKKISAQDIYKMQQEVMAEQRAVLEQQRRLFAEVCNC